MICIYGIFQMDMNIRGYLYDLCMTQKRKTLTEKSISALFIE